MLKKWLFALAFTLLLLSGSLTILRRAEAKTEWIAFIGNQNGDIGIYRMQPDGSDLVKIATPDGWSESLQWSPQGGWLIFQTNSRNGQAIYRVHVTGGGLRQLTDAAEYGTEPAWSPDGEWIAYSASENGRFAIMLMRPNGADKHSLIDYGNYIPHSLMWSPQGDWLAYEYYEFIMRVSRDGKINERVRHTNSYQSMPYWSPNSQSMIYVSTETGHAQLYRTDFGPGIPKRLTTTDDWISWPSWSPQGQWIAFVAVPGEGGGEVQQINRRAYRNLYRVPAAGGDIEALTERFQITETPSWSPDGKWLLMVSEHQRGLGIYRLRADGSQTERLASTLLDTQYLSPTWSSTTDLPFHGARLLLLSIVLLGAVASVSMLNKRLNGAIPQSL